MKLNSRTLILSFALIFLSGQFIQCKESKPETIANIQTAGSSDELAETSDPTAENEPASTVSNDIKIKELKKSEIPNEVEYEGEFHKAFSFTDAEGDHIVVLSEKSYTTRNNTSEYADDYKNIELHAYMYTMEWIGYAPTWQMLDFTRECELDNMASFLDDFPIFTDLDNNGVYEVWIQYYLGCAGDVSPKDMKLLMYQRTDKYAMRGEQAFYNKWEDRVEKDGGEYKFDEAFLGAPAEFRDFAEKLWEEKGSQTINWTE